MSTDSIELGMAIAWKFNDVSGVQTINGVITKFPAIDGVTLTDGLPSQSDQDSWVTEYKAHLVAIAYKSARVIAYPTIGDQLDALWKGGDDQAAMKVIVDKVKSDNPKPS